MHIDIYKCIYLYIHIDAYIYIYIYICILYYTYTYLFFGGVPNFGSVQEAHPAGAARATPSSTPCASAQGAERPCSAMECYGLWSCA